MAKETLIIGERVQSFNYLRRQGFCKKAKETSVICLIKLYNFIKGAGTLLLFDFMSRFY